MLRDHLSQATIAGKIKQPGHFKMIAQAGGPTWDLLMFVYLIAQAVPHAI